jgi:hypothetical protein
MSRYHHLVDVHADNANLINGAAKNIVEAIEAGELNKAKRMVMDLENQSSRMQTAFDEMALLVRVMMLELQADDNQRRGYGTARPRPKAPISRQREIQLELFDLLTEIQAKRRSG